MLPSYDFITCCSSTPSPQDKRFSMSNIVPISPNNYEIYRNDSVEQLNDVRKKHDRRGSTSPPADFAQPLPLALVHANDHRNGSIFYTNSVHKPFLSSSASS